MGEAAKIKSELAILSARYILEELNHNDGWLKMAQITNLPMGVIVEAFGNIFYEREDEIK